VVGEFLRKYDGHPLPRTEIALNVLEDMGVPSKRAADVLTLISDGAASVGYIHEIKGRPYVDLKGSDPVPLDAEADNSIESSEASEHTQTEPEESSASHLTAEGQDHKSGEPKGDPGQNPRTRRVFVSHGKNKALIAPIKKLLAFGELEPVISTEKQSVSQPVPDKVMDDMRSCGAAIIHVDAEQLLLDSDAKEHLVLNPNVLIEIGAAMALYGRRVVLLVRDSARLPSNLQGLFEVRHSGEGLSGDATIRLLEAINDIKNHKIPS